MYAGDEYYDDEITSGLDARPVKRETTMAVEMITTGEAKIQAKAAWMRAKWARERAERKVQRLQDAKAKREEVRAQTRILREREAAEKEALAAYHEAKIQAKTNAMVAKA